MVGRHSKKHRSYKENTGRRRRLSIFAVSFIGTIVLLSGATYSLLKTPLDQFKGVVAQPSPPPKPIHNADRTNILLIGTDTRPGEPGGNTDVLILVSIDNLHKRIEMMSIPRDTKVTYPSGVAAKVNQSLIVGGPSLTIQLVKSLLHQPVDYYTLTHFGGLVDVIDTIGGIQLNVPHRMYYDTGDKQWNIIDLQPGLQNLTGTQALGFVRFRHDALGDIGRTQRQQEFLTSLSRKLLQPDNVGKLPTLIRQFWSTVDTNMSILEVGGLSKNAKQYSDYQIIHETLPGSFHNPDQGIRNDQSYWIINPSQAVFVAKQFFENGIVQQNPVQDPATTQSWSRPVSPDAVEKNKTNVTRSVTVNTDRSHARMVSVNDANIRSGPGTNFPTSRSVGYGQIVYLVDKQGSWDKIRLPDGSLGYIADWLVTPVKTIQ